MILLLDNYDSFTYNLYHFLGELGAVVDVRRNDAVDVAEAMEIGRDGIVISPGPCDPDRAGISLTLVEACARAGRPLLGVCLGHQAIFQAFGGTVGRAPQLMHGKTSAISHDTTGLFDGLPNPFTATRYHSLHGQPETVPNVLTVTARSDDGQIMAVAHHQQPVFGVQFHPESIETSHGHALLQNFLRLARARQAA
ncbi:MAG: aminodeoxychorismate/anthranilate synthase component II [Pseudomonadota bacterium]